MKHFLFSTIFLTTVLRAQRPPERAETWVHPDSHQLWTSKDNGAGISGLQADRYCSELSIGGLRGWRLPSIEELQSLVADSANESGYHVKGPLRLTGWQWSVTEGEQKGERWAIDFGDGARASVFTGDSGLNRALCVCPASVCRARGK